MGAKFSSGGATVFHDRTDTPGEIVTELVNASDGAGLHFNGTSGTIDIASPPDLGTKFSFELIVQADAIKEFALIDFYTGGRLWFGLHGSTGKVAFYDTDYRDFSVGVLDDLKVHHLVATVDGTAATLYDNGNQVSTVTLGRVPNVNDCTDAIFPNTAFAGTFYRCRLWNKTLSSTEVNSVYESASIDFADQWGSQTNKIAAAADKNWGTNQADTGNDTNDRATFDTNYVWTINQTVTDISVASNVLQFTTGTVYHGIYYPAVLTANKRYRVTIKTGAITGDGFKVFQYGSALMEIGTLAASTTNIFEFTTPANSNTNLLVYGSNADGSSGAGTIQLDGTSVANSIVEIGAVADFDLAFANPTQATIVQDRAGVADGTANGGVTQISPIEAVNTNKLNVSGVTPLVGIGLAAGVTPEAALDVRGAPAVIPALGVHGNIVSLLRPDGLIGISGGIDSADNSFYLQSQNFSNNQALGIVLNPKGGNVGIGVSPSAPLQVAATPSDTVGTVGISLKDSGNAIEFGLRLDATSKDLHIDRYYSGAWHGPVMTFDRSSGNVGLGVVPEATHSAQTSLQIGGNANISTTKAQGASGELDILHNAYYAVNGNHYYISSDEASMIRQGGGQFVFRNAPSGTAGSPGDIATFTDRLRISSAGLATFSNGIKLNGASGLNIDQSKADGGVQHLSGKTTCADGVLTEVAFVSHSHLLEIKAWANASGHNYGGAKFDLGTNYGSSSITRTFHSPSSEVTDVTASYLNTGGSTSYVLRIKADLATESTCTVYWTISGYAEASIYAI